MIWNFQRFDKDLAGKLSRQLDLSPAIAGVMVMQGVKDVEFAEKFLRPKISYISDPFAIKNIDRAVERIVAAIKNNEKVSVVGDYDVDGITSVALLVSFLRKFGASPKFFVPRRLTEGYGLSTEIIHRVLNESDPSLIISLDCGTNATSEIEFLKKANCDIIIIDHHKMNVDELADCCLVNPHVNEEDDISYRSLCTVGLVFKVCHALLKHMREANNSAAFEIKLRDYLDFVALGTIADMVPLVGENRIFCKFGLDLLSGLDRRIGIQALCQVSDLPAGVHIYPADVSFKLSPRINACGRLCDGVLPVKMLLSDDFEKAQIDAYELDELNRERQSIEKTIVEEAEKIVKKHNANDAGIVLFNENWHSGVVGVVSGKLARDYRRPCVVLGLERGFAKGSGRGVSGVNLVEVLTKCNDLLDNWGGHPLAVGISLKQENVEKFAKKFNEVVASVTSVSNFDEEIDIAADISPDDIDDEMISQLEALQPFGQGNPEPIFVLKNICLKSYPERFGNAKSHFSFWIERDYAKRLFGIGWNMAKNIPPIGTHIDFAVKIGRSFWNGNHSIRLTLVDWRLSSNMVI